MSPTDKAEFSTLLSGCLGALYDKPVTPLLLDVWFRAMEPYPFEEISRAFSRHAIDPDQGQYPPKPADIVRLIDGNGAGRAQSAWTQVDKTLRCVGGYRSVCFDDPLTNAALDGMGGWIRLCETKLDEIPYRAAEFTKRYRALLLTPPKTWPPHLPGRAELANAANGLPVEPPLLIGDPDQAARVLLGGTAPLLRARPAMQAVPALLARADAA